MTSRDFVIWLRGFTAGAHKFNITPEQWDTLKDELAQVKDLEDDENYEIGSINVSSDSYYTTSTASFPKVEKELLKD
jgi:hypothetical protein